MLKNFEIQINNMHKISSQLSNVIFRLNSLKNIASGLFTHSAKNKRQNFPSRRTINNKKTEKLAPRKAFVVFHFPRFPLHLSWQQQARKREENEEKKAQTKRSIVKFMKVILFATGITVLFRLLFEVYHPPQPQPTPAGNTVCVCVTGNKEAIMFITLRCFRHLPSLECRHFCFLSVRERKIFFFFFARKKTRTTEGTRLLVCVLLFRR